MEIRKFILPNFSKKEEDEVREIVDILKPEVKIIEEEEEIFADQNSLAEIGHEIVDNNKIHKISLTEEELAALLDKAREEALEAKITLEEPVTITEQKPEIDLSEEINLLKEKITVELHGLLDKMIDLALVIANKLIAKVDYNHLAFLIKEKVQSLGNLDLIKIEVPNAEIAEKLLGLGIELSVNNAMLSGDYKIIWCNGFLEKKIEDIAKSIDKVILENKNFN
jgi:hypothetical protein